MVVFPVVSVSDGSVLTGASTLPNAEQLAAAVNRHAGAEVVRVGASFAFNPAWGKGRDPEQVFLSGLVAAATGGSVGLPVPVA